MLSEIEEAFGRHLSTTPGVMPIVWPNKNYTAGKPYVDVQHVPTSNDSPGLAGGGGEVERGYFMVTVVTASNQFTGPANAQAGLIKARFAKATTLDVGSRKFRILQPPQFLPGFADDTDWRQPVRVEYIVTAR